MSFNRRNFLKGMGLLGLGASIPTQAKSTDQHKIAGNESTVQSEIFDFAAAPYLQNLQADHVTICSIFTKPCFAWVERLDANGKVLETIYQVEDGMRNANVEHFKFKVRRNGTEMKYRVVAKEVTKFDPYKIEYGKQIQSADFTAQLAQPDQDQISCLILNDIHETKESYGLLYNQSKLVKKDLVFLNGDSFHYVSTAKDLTNKLLQPVTTSFASISPFVMVRGNHETRGKFARDFKQYFDYPENKFYHSFKMGPIYWIVLDSGEDKPDEHEVYGGTVDYDHYRLEQKAWLEKVLKSKERKSAKHTIVVTHIPFHHSDDWHGTQHNKLCFHEVLQNNKVDAVISGHTHEHSFHAPDNEHNYYVLIGGGPKAGNRTYIEVKAQGKQLQVDLIKESGEQIQGFRKG